jgi:glycosyltransferase involved in cell wall biosynthesis
MRFSVCITTLNDATTLRKSLSSLFSEIDLSETEVVVADSESRDGSTSILREYEAKGKLKLIVRKCSVGMGRQLAFLNSTGENIVAYLDTDDTFSGLREKLAKYLAAYCGKTVKARDFLIVPRSVVEEVGGWRDLHTAEDLEFLQRVRKRFDVVEVPWSVKVEFRARRFRMPFRAIEAVRKMWDMIGLDFPPDRYILNRKWRVVYLFLVALHRLVPQGGPKKNRLADYVISLARG